MTSIVIVGQGYVGIPLAIEFGKYFPTIGFDISTDKIQKLKAGNSPGGEVDAADLKRSPFLSFSDNPECLAGANFIILAVPTLVNAMHLPDLSPIIAASKTVGKYMSKGTIVIYESTVYPGVTEEVCIPAIEKSSGFKWKTDFNVGYSPERVNPGDKNHSLSNVIKIVSGDDLTTLKKISKLYKKIVKAGIYSASCIKVAEAAKVVENTQRDLNIGLMNEVAIISHLVGIDTKEVIDAASTKWNFMPMRPGLVGGHCISVVPYYLTYKAEMLGYHPAVIMAGRKINDGMGKYIAEQTIKEMIATGIAINGAKVCVFGIAFKENIEDISNSKIIDTIKELEAFGVEVLVHDPVVRNEMAEAVYGIKLMEWDLLPPLDAIILAVAHDSYMHMSIKDLTKKLRPTGCFIDIPSAIPKNELKDLGISTWRL